MKARIGIWIRSESVALLCLVGLLVPFGARAGAAAEREKQADREVAVTVYNQNLGVVKDRRTFSISKGSSDLRFTDVAALIDPTSVHLRPLGRSPIEILWQDFRFDLVSTDKLLQRYVDEAVEVTTKDDQVKRGTLLSYDSGSLVLRDANGGLTLVNRSEVRQVGLRDLPSGLITRPTLVWRLSAAAAGNQPLEVSYMTGGMSWHAEYVGVLDAAGTKLDLQGWASIENRSGATYDDAAIKLVAGAIHRAPIRRPVAPDYMRGKLAAEVPMEVQERGFFEYHLYEIPLRATLADNEVKQLGLLAAANITCGKKFTYEASRDPERVMVSIEFQNDKTAGLGMPLPEGVVRIFQRDEDGALELAGEDRIDHTAKNERVRVAVGGAFDINAERKQTDHRQVTARVLETAYEIELRSHKTETVNVTVVEHAWGDWEIVKSSHTPEKKDATTVEFIVRLEPEKPVTITYTLRTRT